MPFVTKKINEYVKNKNINIIHIRSRAPSWLLPYIDRNNISMIQPFKGVPKYDLDDLVLNEVNFGKIKISTIGAKKEIHYTGATKSRKTNRKKTKQRKSKKRKSKKRKSKKRKYNI